MFIFPISSRAYLLWGNLCEAEGKITSASEKYRAALNADPGNQKAEEALATVGKHFAEWCQTLPAFQAKRLWIQWAATSPRDGRVADAFANINFTDAELPDCLAEFVSLHRDHQGLRDALVRIAADDSAMRARAVLEGLVTTDLRYGGSKP